MIVSSWKFYHTSILRQRSPIKLKYWQSFGRRSGYLWKTNKEC